MFLIVGQAARPIGTKLTIQIRLDPGIVLSKSRSTSERRNDNGGAVGAYRNIRVISCHDRSAQSCQFVLEMCPVHGHKCLDDDASLSRFRKVTVSSADAPSHFFMFQQDGTSR